MLPDGRSRAQIGSGVRDLSNDDCRDGLEAAARDRAHLHHAQPQIALFGAPKSAKFLSVRIDERRSIDESVRRTVPPFMMSIS